MNSVSLVDGHIDGQGLTDEQIIQDLLCCIKGKCFSEKCTFSKYIKDEDISQCTMHLAKNSFDLINRLKTNDEENEAKLAHQAETIFILEKALSDRMTDIERLEGILNKRCDFCPQNARIEALAKQIEELSGGKANE